MLGGEDITDLSLSHAEELLASERERLSSAGSRDRLWRFDQTIERVRSCVERGGVLGIPTESSYGLAVDPGNREAVECVFRVKGRRLDQPLPVVVGDFAALERLGVQVDDGLRARLGELWPAALTVVLPIRHPVAASAGRDTLAVRIPKHERLRGLLNRLGIGLTATSANLSGESAILDPEGLLPLLESTDAVVVDGGVLEGWGTLDPRRPRRKRLAGAARGRLPPRTLGRPGSATERGRVVSGEVGQLSGPIYFQPQGAGMAAAGIERRSMWVARGSMPKDLTTASTAKAASGRAAIRRSVRAVGLGLSLLATLAALSASGLAASDDRAKPPSDPEVMPIEEVVAGQKGYGLSVFQRPRPRAIRGRGRRRDREHASRSELRAGAPERAGSRGDRRHRRDERQSGLHRRPPRRRGGFRLALLTRGDRRHHADLDDA